jgi:hypothetical protein
MRRSPVRQENGGWRLGFGVRRSRSCSKSGAEQRNEVLRLPELDRTAAGQSCCLKRVFAKLPFSGNTGLQRPAPSAQKPLAIELVDATGTMTITVVPRPGAVWISNRPPISEAL